MLNKKFSIKESKVKVLGSPLMAEPSGRCCRRYGQTNASI